MTENRSKNSRSSTLTLTVNNPDLNKLIDSSRVSIRMEQNILHQTQETIKGTVSLEPRN